MQTQNELEIVKRHQSTCLTAQGEKRLTKRKSWFLAHYTAESLELNGLAYNVIKEVTKYFFHRQK